MNFETLKLQCIAHATEHPTHGINCSCMDELIRQVRRETHIVEGPTADDAIQENAQRRVEWILSTAGKHRY